MKDFWTSIGIFTKVVLFINVLSYMVQNLIIAKLVNKADEPNFNKVALCPTAVIDEGQWYRLMTSELTHGNLSHILCNMCIFMVWGNDLEKHYGTMFYATLNVMLGFTSNVM